MNLHKYFLNNSSLRIHKWLHYFDIYERHFNRFVNKSPVVLEIGVFGGGSLKMWKDYFGDGCKVIGIDINPECKQYESEGIEIYIGSQDDPNLIESILNKYPSIDVLIDDGSHMMTHMIRSFELLYSHISENGVYLVEDTHTCYWEEYEGGLKKQGSFMEFAKDRVDMLNAVHSRNSLPVTEFTKTTDSISFYDSIVVFEKRRQGKRQAPMTESMD
ncbi:class I SAM-dependent methyltransferase [Vibrio hannami]|uniref:class I SAM-dependent methyltransferase n=1 Tax=Vibrio hannami TaxID=2717094 RepID=UPI00240FFF29|nr:class I SAM-dependent methyltransferase [Vibrio hannami]MDG3086928.1 class I SAM-dependent methyltransferase [Vibrio hannami]